MPVERQFEIVGEALNQLRRVDAGLAARIGDLPRIVAFRNIRIRWYPAGRVTTPPDPEPNDS